MVLIDFPDSSVINNLLPVYTVQPDVLCMVFDENKTSREIIENFRDALLNRTHFLEIKEYICDGNDIESITNVLNQIVREYDQEKIYADVSGGPELMTACACMLGKEGELCPLYIDLEEKLLFGVFDKEVRFRAKKITMDDYVTMRGARHYSDSRSRPSEEEFERICKMAEEIFGSLDEWQLLDKYLCTCFCAYTGLDFSIKNLHCSKEHMQGIKRLLDKFIEYDFISRRDEDRYVIKSPKYREYLTSYGIWLEMYIYIKARSCFEEAHLGFIIDWNRRDNIDTDDNEFDVVFIYNNRPVFISCKMTKPTSKDLTEIGYLSKLLGGEDAISILATTYPIHKTNEMATGLYNRMKKMNIGFIETKRFRKLSAKEVFEEAIDFIQ